MITFDDICDLVSKHFDIDCNSEDYSVKFIFADEFEDGYALIEWHIIDRATNKDFGSTYAIISSYGEIIECPCDIWTSELKYRNNVRSYLEELREEVAAKEREWCENQAEWDEEYARDANRQFRDLIDENEAWGNID